VSIVAVRNICRWLAYGVALKLLCVSVASIGAEIGVPVDVNGGSGKDSGKAIDWENIKQFGFIPHELTSTDSDKAIGAGFVHEWVDRSLGGVAVLPVKLDSTVSVRADKLADDIISSDRQPDDLWAHEVDRHIREDIGKHADAYATQFSRVFCNDVGCLCYIEGTRSADIARITADVLHGVRGGDGWGKQYGITESDIYQVALISRGGVLEARQPASWWMYFIVRSSGP
jgi:hypothetical protein